MKGFEYDSSFQLVKIVDFFGQIFPDKIKHFFAPSVFVEFFIAKGSRRGLEQGILKGEVSLYC